MDLDEAEHKATVKVAADQQSLAIGRGWQNVRKQVRSGSFLKNQQKWDRSAADLIVAVDGQTMDSANSLIEAIEGLGRFKQFDEHGLSAANAGAGDGIQQPKRPCGRGAHETRAASLASVRPPGATLATCLASSLADWEAL